MESVVVSSEEESGVNIGVGSGVRVESGVESGLESGLEMGVGTVDWRVGRGKQRVESSKTCLSLCWPRLAHEVALDHALVAQLREIAAR